MKYLILLLFPFISLAQPSNPSGDPDDTVTVVVDTVTITPIIQDTIIAPVDTVTVLADTVTTPVDTVTMMPAPVASDTVHHVLSPVIANLKREKQAQQKNFFIRRFYKRDFFNTHGWKLWSASVVMVVLTVVKSKDGINKQP